jgi:hypothetical protein
LVRLNIRYVWLKKIFNSCKEEKNMILTPEHKTILSQAYLMFPYQPIILNLTKKKKKKKNKKKVKKMKKN